SRARACAWWFTYAFTKSTAPSKNRATSVHRTDFLQLTFCWMHTSAKTTTKVPAMYPGTIAVRCGRSIRALQVAQPPVPTTLLESREPQAHRVKRHDNEEPHRVSRAQGNAVVGREELGIATQGGRQHPQERSVSVADEVQRNLEQVRQQQVRGEIEKRHAPE